MKHAIYGIVLAFVMLITSVIALVISGRSVRQNEADRALDTAAEQTIKEWLEDEAHPVNVETKEELVSDLLEGIAVKIESDSAVSIFLSADNTKGLLGVRVEEEFVHPNGNPGRLQTEKTVVMEQYEKAEKRQFSVLYLAGGEDYKIYHLTEGERLPVPASPEGEFICWLNEQGQPVDVGTITADADRVFTASFAGR